MPRGGRVPAPGYALPGGLCLPLGAAKHDELGLDDLIDPTRYSESILAIYINEIKSPTAIAEIFSFSIGYIFS